MVDCVILAGGISAIADEPGEISNKALIKIGGMEMVRRVLEVYRQVQEIGRIVLVGPVDKLSFLKDDYPLELAEESDSIIHNLSVAIKYLQTDRHLLVSTADIPLLTPTAVTDFLEKCRPYDCDFYYPVVTRESCERQFPGVRRTFVTLQEGSFAGGNIFLINPEKIEPSIPIVSKFIEYRKKPLKMVSLLGAGLVWRAVTGKLSISQAEERFSALLNVKPRAVISDYAEIAFDVDKQSDLELVRQFLS